MLAALAAVTFAAATIGCAHRLRYATRAREYLVFVPFVVGAWVALLTVREPTPLNMTLSFLLLDMSIMALATLALFRALGAFDPDPWGADDDDGRDGDDPPEPGPAGDPSDPRGLAAPPRAPRRPSSPRRPRGTRPVHRPHRTPDVVE